MGKTKAYLSFTLAKGTQAETTITAPTIIADIDAYDVILGMDSLGPCFGYVDPLTEGFIWRVDCHETETMPVQIARLPATCRAKSFRERRHLYMLSLISSGEDLQDSMLGDESKEENFSQVNFMETDTVINTVPIKLPNIFAFATLPSDSPLTSRTAFNRRHEAGARLDAVNKIDVPLTPPWTKWIGGANHGAVPISTSIATLDQTAKQKGLHVLDLFAGISCGGLRTVLEAGYVISCYTSVEIDDISRVIARKTLDDLQAEYPGQLPDKAFRGYDKRLPQNIQFVGDSELTNLIRDNGSVDFICGGWECQSMSLAGKHLGMEDDRFMPFLDAIRIINFLQA